ncbi:hypothetical protein [Lachnoclostridium phytofermentans]|uniref:hypothetical protein n=1 Tax=Lachnoclostridium phytofermentans TaxID=66219 RepID=UPI00049672CA|nr:hypothetical protein [Lachnoclostridium phytofermentans]
MIKMKHEIQGSILDIGGGGEGVISSIYGKDVTAIDYRKDELDELQYDSMKLVINNDLQRKNILQRLFFLFLCFLKINIHKIAPK